MLGLIGQVAQDQAYVADFFLQMLGKRSPAAAVIGTHDESATELDQGGPVFRLQAVLLTTEKTVLPDHCVQDVAVAPVSATGMAGGNVAVKVGIGGEQPMNQYD